MVRTQGAVIESNFQEVKESLLEGLKRYEGIVVTNENLKDCKATQRDLARVRKGIDEYRKSIKKEINKPLVEFENMCKELMGLVVNVESPIKQSITEFDDKRRIEKKQIALEEIQKAIAINGLEKEFSEELTVLDKYLLLTSSRKSISEDIQVRAEEIRKRQDAAVLYRNCFIETVNETVSIINQNINLKLDPKDFYKYIDMNWNTNDVIKEINSRAEYIRMAEEKKDAEVNKVQEIKPVTENEKFQKSPVIEGSKYFVDVFVKSDLERIKLLSKFLKDNGYEYEVKRKGKVDDDN